MKKVLLALSPLLLCANITSAVGSRIAYIDAFATARGNAYTATADSASAVFYNPAGLTQLAGTEVQGGVYAFSAEHTYKVGPFEFETDDSFEPLPSFFAAHKFEDQPFAIGFGSYAPFALGVDWGQDAPFSDLGYKSQLYYLKSHLVVAWQVTDTLSIGFGPSFDYGDIELHTTGPLGTFEGDDHTFGFSFGILWQPNEHHSFGLNYQHATELEFDGKQKNFSIGPATTSGSAEAKLDFPESIILGYSWRPNEKWNIEFNIDWTNWDKVDDLVISNDFFSAAVPLNWESAFFYELGATRFFEGGWHASAGITYTENAIPSEEFSPLVPDANRTFLNFGIGRDYENLSWQVTYQFSVDTERQLSSQPGDPSFPINGEYDLESQSIAASLSYRF
ncbi:hypothetical protein DDZ13_06300 [Coraliomargarita sinensis]|uniref:Aromatic hydrocarbon degradation protein n=1 Tax=Coraliomargarita sinensis TaxID=2174842 RepID=A0A317ZGS0_9BACT|nr:outer membrane protein transport protein [Coraliomargarita sinensis]PXA04776.1 hypothetical protein DDZ13_06300 [Coraliomargarita sinensis]